MASLSLSGLREHIRAWFAGNRLARWLEAVLVVLLAVALADLTWKLIPGPGGSGLDTKAASGAGQASGTMQAGPGKRAGSSPGSEALPGSLKGLFGTPSEPQEEETGAKAEPVRETTLDLALKGIIATQGEGPKLAVIAPGGGEEKIYRPGDKVKGRAEILRIEERRVILLRNGVTEALKLKVPEGVSQRRMTDTGTETGIRQIGENKRVVSKDTLKKKLDNLPKLLRQAKAVPASRDGRKIGFRVVNIQEGSVFEDLGVEKGDVIQQVNGRRIRTPRQAMEAYRELQGGQQFRLKVLRDGKSETLTYAVE